MTIINTKSHKQYLVDRYLDMLERWCKVHNLTAINKREQMREQLVEQSMKLQTHLVGKVVDVGTGAGIPGIPLAIAMPDMHFTLIDSRSKKITFLQHVINELDLPNIDLINKRVEDCRLGPFDTIVSRALGSFYHIFTITANLRHDTSRFLFVRGHFERSELAGVPLRLVSSIELSADGKNNLVIMVP